VDIFPMFVPSLSWQNDHFSIETTLHSAVRTHALF
jgi:hypothetical protein